MSASTELAPSNGHGELSPIQQSTLEQVIVGGNLSTLSPAERVSYYSRVCDSLGLNPYTKPFQYINLNGKLTLYATRDCTDQLRGSRKVSITKLDKEFRPDMGLYIVTAHAQTPDGRTDASTAAVNIKGLVGEPLANALMKGETKAKRRVTLSICGLGWTDESETDSIPGAHFVQVTDTGEIARAEAPKADPQTGEVIEAEPVSPSPVAARNAEWKALQETEGFPKGGDKAHEREFVSHLLRKPVPKLGDLTAVDFAQARAELLERNKNRRHWFALMAEYGLVWSDEKQREELGKILGREVKTRTILTSTDWTRAIDGLAQYGPPSSDDPFADNYEG